MAMGIFQTFLPITLLLSYGIAGTSGAAAGSPHLLSKGDIPTSSSTLVHNPGPTLSPYTDTVTVTANGPCTSTPYPGGVTVEVWDDEAYSAKKISNSGRKFWDRDVDNQASQRVWLKVDVASYDQEIIAEELARRGRANEVLNTGLELSSVKLEPRETVKKTVPTTIPGTACPTPLLVSDIIASENCLPDSLEYTLLIFDDAIPEDTSPDHPILQPPPPLPGTPPPTPPGAWDYSAMRFSPGWVLFHCQANTLPYNDPHEKACDTDTKDGVLYIALHHRPNETLANTPVKRSISFPGGRSFSMHSLLLSAFPVPSGEIGGGSRGIVSVIFKGFISRALGARATFVDVRYIRGGDGGRETLQKITYKLSFFDLVRVEIVAVEGVWILGDAEDWGAVERTTGKAKWEGRGARVWIDNLAVCRNF